MWLLNFTLLFCLWSRKSCILQCYWSTGTSQQMPITQAVLASQSETSHVTFCPESPKSGCHICLPSQSIATEWKTGWFWTKPSEYVRVRVHRQRDISAAITRGKLHLSECWTWHKLWQPGQKLVGPYSCLRQGSELSVEPSLEAKFWGNAWNNADSGLHEWTTPRTVA